MIDSGEVGDDDRNRKGDHQHAGQGAHASHNLSGDGFGNHVAVPESRERETTAIELTGWCWQLRNKHVFLKIKTYPHIKELARQTS